jgi:hypothetical protein
MTMTRSDFLKLLTIGSGGALLTSAFGCGDDSDATSSSSASQSSSSSSSSSGGGGGNGGASSSSGPGGSPGTGGSGGDPGNGGSPGVGGSGGGGTNACKGSVSATISENHQHVLVISLDDINAGMEKTYMSRGSSKHNHSLLMTAQDFQDLKDGKSVTINNSEGHTHEWTLKC